MPGLSLPDTGKHIIYNTIVQAVTAESNHWQFWRTHGPQAVKAGQAVPAICNAVRMSMVKAIRASTSKTQGSGHE